MGLFTRGPEHNEEWAGLPSEPARPESDAERLADAIPVRLDGFGGDGGAVESIVIPVAPIIDIAQPDVTDGDSED